jgi:O-antigen/teichoic acid export membrane protein
VNNFGISLNKVIKFQLFRNTFLSFIRFLSSAIVFFIIARLLGTENVGVYSLAIKFQLIFGILSVWGLDTLMIREMVFDRSKEVAYLINFLLVRIIFTVVSFLILILLITFAFDYTSFTSLFIIVLSINIIPEGINTLFHSYFISREEFIPSTFIMLFLGLSRVFGVYWIIISNSTLILLALLIPATSLIGVFIYLALIISKENKIKQFSLSIFPNYLDKEFLYKELIRSNPLAFIRILYTLLWQSDIILISILGDVRGIGIYSTASITIGVFMFFLSGYQEAIYPYLSKLYSENSKKFWESHPNLTKAIGILIIPIASLFTIFIKYIIPIVFGVEYHQSIDIAYVLLGSVIISFFDVHNMCLIVIAGNPTKLNFTYMIAIITNLILTIFLMPIYGILGVALSKLISIILLVFLNGTIVRFTIKDLEWGSIMTKLVISTGIMKMTFWFLHSLPILIRLVFSFLFFLGSLFLLRIITRDQFILQKE